MKGVTCAVVVAAAMSLSGCLEKELSTEEKALVSQLNSELTQTKHEISSANANAAQYSGGLLKQLIQMRIEVLKTNQALLEQRVHAVESGAAITIQPIGTSPDEALAANLAQEIQSARSAVELSRAEADQYTGGLLRVLKLTTLATNQQTVALLEQRYLSAKYGLGTPALPLPNSTPSAPAAAAQGEAETAEVPPGDGPLGLEAGLGKDEIEAMLGSRVQLINAEENLYTSKSSPKPNSSFETIAMVISPTVGLCQIRAVGRSVETNGFGHQLQANFTGLREALEGVYGTAKVFDNLMYGSIWKEPDEWMMGLLKKDRDLMAEWQSTPERPLKSSVQHLSMETRAENPSKGYVLVQYSFTNYESCRAELKNKVRDSL